jgi:hypothetical protein
MSEQQPTEEEMRAALEEQLRQLTVDDMLIESCVSLINLGGRKAGLAAGTEGERDLPQVQRAIEAVRALLPVVEQGKHAQQLGPLRDALARLQMAYAQQAGEAPPKPEGAPERKPEQAKEGEPGPAQKSGRLWVPGQ